MITKEQKIERLAVFLLQGYYERSPSGEIRYWSIPNAECLKHSVNVENILHNKDFELAKTQAKKLLDAIEAE